MTTKATKVLDKISAAQRRKVFALFKRAIMSKDVDSITMNTDIAEPPYLDGGPFRVPIEGVSRRYHTAFTISGWTTPAKGKVKK